MSKRLATEGMKNSHLTGQNLQRNQKIICRDQLGGEKVADGDKKLEVMWAFMSLRHLCSV